MAHHMGPKMGPKWAQKLCNCDETASSFSESTRTITTTARVLDFDGNARLLVGRDGDVHITGLFMTSVAYVHRDLFRTRCAVGCATPLRGSARVSAFGPARPATARSATCRFPPPRPAGTSPLSEPRGIGSSTVRIAVFRRVRRCFSGALPKQTTWVRGFGMPRSRRIATRLYQRHSLRCPAFDMKGNYGSVRSFLLTYQMANTAPFLMLWCRTVHSSFPDIVFPPSVLGPLSWLRVCCLHAPRRLYSRG